MKRWTVRSLVGAFVFLPAWAAEPSLVLEAGKPLALTLPAGPSTKTERRLEFVAPASGPFIVEARSLDVDTGLRLLRAAPMADDDGGIGTDSRLAFEAAAGERSTIVVHAVENDWGGEVEVRVDAAARAVPLPTGDELARVTEAYWSRVEERARALGRPAREARAWIARGGDRFDDRPAEAREHFAKAIALLDGGKAGPARTWGDALSLYGSACMRVGEYAAADDALRRALPIREAAWGSDSLELGYTLGWLAESAWRAGRLDEAEQHYRRAIAIYEQRRGAADVQTGWQYRSLGTLVRQRGRAHDSCALLERALAISEASSGSDAPETLRVLAELARSYGADGQDDQAVEAWARVTAGGDTPELLEPLSQQAAILARSGKVSGARAAAERALRIADAHPGASATAAANARNTLGVIVAQRGDLAGGIEHLARAVALAESAPDRDDQLLAGARANLAMFEQKRGGTEALARLLETARADASAAIDARSLRRMMDAAALLDVLHARDEAGAVLLRAEEIALAQPQLSDDGIDALGRLAIELALLGRYDEARERGRRALDALRSRPADPLGAQRLAAALRMTAQLDLWRGEYESARTALDESARIEETRTPVDVRAESALLALRARLAQTTGRPDAALAAARASVARLESAYGDRDSRLAPARVALARILAAGGHNEEAAAQCRRVIAIAKGRISAEDLFQSLTARLLLARVLVDDGRSKESLDSLVAFLDEVAGALGNASAAAKKALVSMSAALRANAPDGSVAGDVTSAIPRMVPGLPVPAFQIAQVCGMLGEILLGLRCPRDAAAFLETARTLAEGEENPDLSRILDALARASWDAGQEDRARDAAADAARVIDARLRTAVAVLPEGQALAMARAVERPQDVLLSGLVAGRARKDAWLKSSWESVLRHRALILEELADRHAANSDGGDPEAVAARRRLAAARRRLASLWLGTDGARTIDGPAQLVAATFERDAAEAELARRSARFRERRAAQGATLDAVSRSLPRKAALIEYVRFRFRDPASGASRDRYAALILPGGAAAPAWSDLGEGSKIDAEVAEWSAALRAAWDESWDPATAARLDTAGRRLRESIWDPVRRAIPDATTAFVVPDGLLHRVSIEALPMGEGYVADSELRVHLLSTGRDLVRPPSEPAATRTVARSLEVGDPDYDEHPLEGIESAGPVFRGAASPCMLGGVRWKRLPESAREAERIAALLGAGSALLTRGAAGEAVVKTKLPGSGVAHFATHAFFLAGDCALDNPLLRSGLVLAGANRAGEAKGGEDGILTAEEIASLDLRETGLVTLSACDTGRGAEESGEGVLGLRRAFETAGVRSVVMSLWPVPDEAARDWMVGFYRAWSRGTGVLEAAALTRRDRLRALRDEGQPSHPYAWAGFVTAGEWR